MEDMVEYNLLNAESMRDAIMQCKRAGMAENEYAYYLSEMMRRSQSAIDKVVGRSRILRDVKEW
jgi:hypothetical protein